VDNWQRIMPPARWDRIAQFEATRKDLDGMQAMQRGIGRRKRHSAQARARVCALGCLAVAAIVGGCSSTIQTPLPEIKPISTTALSQEDRKKAVEELNRKRATQEQDAEHQIEQSR
jgi:hypothetical protein